MSTKNLIIVGYYILIVIFGLFLLQSARWIRVSVNPMYEDYEQSDNISMFDERIYNRKPHGEPWVIPDCEYYLITRGQRIKRTGDFPFIIDSIIVKEQAYSRECYYYSKNEEIVVFKDTASIKKIKKDFSH